MSEDPFDRFIRTSLPPVDLSQDRVDRLTDAVFARLPAQPPLSAPTRPRARRGGGFVGGWFDLIGRFAVPMATAAALGLVVGAQITPSEGAAQIADLFAPVYLTTGQ